MDGDDIALLDEQADNAAGHGGFESDGAVGADVAATRAEGAGIVNAIRDSLRADVKCGGVGIGIENDTKRLAVDEEGENAGAEEVSVGFDGLAVDTDAPLAG